jgi:hypothetical protein
MTNMKKNIRFTAALVILLGMGLLLASCSEKISGNRNNASVINLSARILAPQSLDSLYFRLQVEGPDWRLEPPVILKDSGGWLVGTAEVPAGPDRIFTVEGFDSVLTYVNDVPVREEIILYRGVDTADVQAGVVNSVDVTLKPVTPMLRIAPRFRHLVPYESFSLSVQLFDTMYYHGITVQVTLDPTHVNFDSVARGADLSSAVSFDWGRDDAGGVVTLYATVGAASAPPDGIFDASKSGEIGRIYYGSNWPSGVVDTIPVSVEPLNWTDTAGQVSTYSALFRSDGMVTLGYDPNASYEISGQVLDAASGQPLAGALVRVEVVEGKAGQTPKVMAGVPDSVVTGADGTYRFTGVPEGYFQISAAKDGYIWIFDNRQIRSSVAMPPFVLTRELPAGRVRFVLSWNELPTDLDAYLWVEDGNVIHLVYHGSQGDSLTVPYAYLDVDDLDSYGPETITMTNFYRPVKFAVHNWSGEVPLAGSGAHVDIYQGAQRLAWVDAPSTGTGDWWYVCDWGPDSSYPSFHYSLSDVPPDPAPDSVSVTGGNSEKAMR